MTSRHSSSAADWIRRVVLQLSSTDGKLALENAYRSGVSTGKKFAIRDSKIGFNTPLKPKASGLMG